ncbi:hypothetical protein CCR75_003804 [Bremia lactucae]|uniref:ELYS-like domain-containing protein n=1 Tax=Bremia lactucae TaxID=4779 RepID=A0A976FJL9_BRELC|nr:hypothetical protein CCR75_003804 [Bremia lactucae]
MLLPVLERFAELGWQPFVEPAETFEFFSVSGVFRRTNVDTTSMHTGQSSTHLFVQRSALFDVCLKSGLASLVVAYIRAEEPRLQPESAFTSVKTYVLKEPIALQQWTQCRLEAMEQSVNEIVRDQQFSRDSDTLRTATIETVASKLRQFNGLHVIIIALIERLREGSREAAMSSNGVDFHGNIKNDTELLRLTTAGVHNLLQLLARTQSGACICNCLLWLYEKEVAAETELYTAFYTQARSLRVTYREQFEAIYGKNRLYKEDSKAPLLLIEHVMESASISIQDLGGSCPPTQLNHLLEILRMPRIQEEMIQFYGDEVDQEPIEGYFRVQVALVLYFCLDRAYLSVWKQHTQNGARIASNMRLFADSFAAQLNVRDEMKMTLLALWLMENAVVVKTSGDDQVAAIYDHAIGLLQQSSVLHIHQQYDLEAQLIFRVLETLVHRGESLVAWKVWNLFGVDLEQCSRATTDLIAIISLELDLWERVLTLIRRQKRLDLLSILFDCLMKSNRLKELVQGATLLPDEEKRFHAYMMVDNHQKEEDILRDDNIKRVDFLVMYYLLRHKYEQAWEVHHEHLAMIRATSRGDSEIAMAVLNQPSLRIRASLLSNMCPEPPTKSFTHQSRHVRREGWDRHPLNKALLVDQDMEHEDEDTSASPKASSTSTKKTSASAFSLNQIEQSTHLQEMAASGTFHYLPGIFSSRQGLSLTSPSIPSSSLSHNDTQKLSSPRTFNESSFNVASIVSSPESVLHTLTCSKPFESISTVSSDTNRLQTPSVPTPFRQTTSSLQSLVSPFGDRRPLGAPPLSRSKIQPSFASSSLISSPLHTGISSEELSLRPHCNDKTLDPTFANELQDCKASFPANGTLQDTTSNNVDMSGLKKYCFVDEMEKNDRLEGTFSDTDPIRSPVTEELEGMELERIDEDFSTPISRLNGRRKEPTSVPVRRNPRRSARHRTIYEVALCFAELFGSLGLIIRPSEGTSIGIPFQIGYST